MQYRYIGAERGKEGGEEEERSCFYIFPVELL